MRGTDHALFGIAGYGGTLLLAHSQFNETLPEPGIIALGALTAIGASLAADIDEKHSISSQGAGIFGSLARVVTKLTGGHRTITHSPFIMVGGLTILCAALIVGHLGPLALGILLSVFIALGFPFIVGKKRRSHLGPLLDIITIALAVGVAWGVQHYGVEPGWWLYAAIPVPYLAHIIGDTPTPQGVPWLSPLSMKKRGFNLFHSGGSFERIVVTPLLVVAIAACVYGLYQADAFLLT